LKLYRRCGGNFDGCFAVNFDLLCKISICSHEQNFDLPVYGQKALPHIE